MTQYPQTDEHTTTVYVTPRQSVDVLCRCGAAAAYDSVRDAVEAAETHRYAGDTSRRDSKRD